MRSHFSGRRISFILTGMIILTVVCGLFFFDIQLESERMKGGLSDASLELKGKILDANASAEKKYNVELILGDQPAKSLIVKNCESFALKLYKDRHYLLQITEKNGQSKVISVYTHLPANDNHFYRFSFIISLEASPQFTYPSAPAALIAYDHELRDFSYSEEITSHFVSRLYSQK
jgi:hypothetical protein